MSNRLIKQSEFLVAKDLLNRAEKILMTKLGCELPVQYFKVLNCMAQLQNLQGNLTKSVTLLMKALDKALMIKDLELFIVN